MTSAWQRLSHGFDVARRGHCNLGGRAGSAFLAAVSRFAGADARLARTWSTRAMALWVLVLLLGYLALYFV
jgi:hypothetical protein